MFIHVIKEIGKEMLPSNGCNVDLFNGYEFSEYFTL